MYANPHQRKTKQLLLIIATNSLFSFIFCSLIKYGRIGNYVFIYRMKKLKLSDINCDKYGTFSLFQIKDVHIIKKNRTISFAWCRCPRSRRWTRSSRAGARRMMPSTRTGTRPPQYIDQSELIMAPAHCNCLKWTIIDFSIHGHKQLDVWRLMCM